MAAPAGESSSSDSNQAYNAVPINVSPNVSPSLPLEGQPTIGLIGMGAMGKMYALALCRAGWKKCVGELSFSPRGRFTEALTHAGFMYAICLSGTSSSWRPTEVRSF